MLVQGIDDMLTFNELSGNELNPFFLTPAHPADGDRSVSMIDDDGEFDEEFEDEEDEDFDDLDEDLDDDDFGDDFDDDEDFDDEEEDDDDDDDDDEDFYEFDEDDE